MELAGFDGVDFTRLMAWVNGEGERLFWQWGGGAVFHFPLDEPQLERHLRTAAGARPVRRLLKAVDQSGSMIGYVELNRIDYEQRTAVVSRVLVGDPANRGQGIGYAMLSAVMDLAWGEMGLAALTLEVFDFNQRALRLYEKLGFAREGERQYTVLGETWPAICMRLNREA